MAATDTKTGIKNRNLARNETFYHRPYCVSSGTTCNTGDAYRWQMISETERVVEVQASAGTVVGGTTVNVDVQKNGVSILTAPISFVTKQGQIIQGVLLSTEAAYTFYAGDICTVIFTRTGAGSFGQVQVTVKTRPLVGSETRS